MNRSTVRQFVAQVFNLLYRRIAFGTRRNCQRTAAYRPACGLKIRDTADCKSALQVIRIAATCWLALSIAATAATLDEASTLRLVPFPKEVRASEGEFALSRETVVTLHNAESSVLVEQISAELKTAGLQLPNVRQASSLPGEKAKQNAALPRGTMPALLWSTKPNLLLEPPAFRTGATAEDYVLEIQPDAILIAAPGEAGLFYGVQTLRQLIRANRHGDKLPCLTIRDWPSLRWRAFQDDLTRGPSSTLAELKNQAALGAFFKHNLFTYYMEYQYAFSKHPEIGPKDGSLTPDELKELVAFAKPLQLDILGNQQSFGHFGRILSHPENAAFRETTEVLCPTVDGTYKLLDDIYSEELPLLPFGFFNVCCDETDGLGTGPSKELAAQIGVGGVYVQHVRRVHDLLKEKYGKRMMMWGDIILNHKDKLDQIPKDTILLTWGYNPQASFESQILPFSQSGYEFFVCPGVNNWSRILPDFAATTINIRNFVRDGAKNGAIGMLNTSWDDDGENFNAPNWHGFAWGAECAWNASVTSPEDFNRRIGAVLFGETGEHFGEAVRLLSSPGLGGLFNGEFWRVDFQTAKQLSDAGREALETKLKTVQTAIRHLQACKNDAVVNAGLLDFFLFGARRLERVFLRDLDAPAAAVAFKAAVEAGPDNAGPSTTKAVLLIRRNRDAYQSLAQEFGGLWQRENRPYALDWTMNRYKDTVAKLDAMLNRLPKSAGKGGEARPHLNPLPQERKESGTRSGLPQSGLKGQFQSANQNPLTKSRSAKAFPLSSDNTGTTESKTADAVRRAGVRSSVPPSFDYFTNSWNVIGLKDYADGTRITPDNELLLADKLRVRTCCGPDRRPLGPAPVKTLHEGWMPIIHLTKEEGSVRYDVTLWATPLNPPTR